MSLVLCRNGGKQIEGIGEGGCNTQEGGRKEGEREGRGILISPKGRREWGAKKKSSWEGRPSFKEAIITPREKRPKKPSPFKLSHGMGKGLMTSTGPVTQGTRHLLMHKGYVVEMVESIIKETNVDPCAEQETEDLRTSSLFYLSRVSLLPNELFFIVCLFFS